MSTAQVALELVVAGVLGLLVVLLPWLGPACVMEIVTSGLAVPALGAAYVLGVVFDKIFDHVLRHDEARVRRRVAEKKPAAPDPFPQDRMEAQLRKGSEAAAWVGYLRARTRLARALAVSAPLVGAALSWSLGRPQTCALLDRSFYDGLSWLAVLPLVGLVAAVLVTLADPAKTSETERSYAPHVAAMCVLHAVPLIALVAAVVDDHGLGTTLRVLVALAGSLVGATATWAHRALSRTYFKFLRAAAGTDDGAAVTESPE